ncbi:tubulin folding cofactor c [Holotrichia oblita]|uniref:Tubulin folding cofactor c n=1 Tax=Holotrichia oblita TaxID=644536 RepID=A0ACB9TAK8_HOLOL|nr:tubulin folding cofactor c [Holotrichia oblita]
MDTVQEKCDRKIEMLTKRDFERKLDLQKEQEIRKLTSADNEKIDYFESVFNEKRRFIANAIDEARNLDIDKLGVHFNNISRDILILQKYLATSNIFLRGYDIKIYQQVLQNLTNQARDLEDELLPKKKFGFKKKTSQKIDVGNGINCFINGNRKKTIDEVDSCALTKINLLEDLNGFSERTDTNLMLSNSEIFKKDILLSKLNNCKIKLFGSPSTLHMNFLKDCYVFCGPVSTSIFAESCENCTFVIACQQLRLHSSKNINIYLHVTSRAIMEDSSNIFIAPYNLEYDNIEEDFKKSGLAGCSNNWTSIDDFNWLKLDQKSPNWNIIDETKRIEKWSNFF